MKYILLSFISIIIFSCNYYDKSSYRSFPFEFDLLGYKPDVDYPNFYYFWDIEIIDSILIGYNFIDHSAPLLYFFDKYTFKYKKSAVMVGRGSVENYVPGTLWVDETKKTIYIQDAGRFSNLNLC